MPESLPESVRSKLCLLAYNSAKEQVEKNSIKLKELVRQALESPDPHAAVTETLLAFYAEAFVQGYENRNDLDRIIMMMNMMNHINLD